MMKLDSPAMILLFLLAVTGCFILWCQVADLITGQRLLKRRPFGRNWQQTLNLVITAAPLAGLLGTVSGLRLAFSAINDNQALLAQGLSEALTTTKIGLLLALLCLGAGFILKKLQRVSP